MADSKQKDSTAKEESRTSGFNFPCGNFEEMSKMMQNFFGGGGSPNDCCEKLQQMCRGTSKESESKP
jgi:hypothetical protein